MKDGNHVVSSDDHIRLRGNVLSIAQSMDSDAGIYQCWGTNSAGRVGTAMYLSIEIMGMLLIVILVCVYCSTFYGL